MTPKKICYFLFAIGFVLFSYSFSLPYYKDELAKQELDSSTKKYPVQPPYSKNTQDYYEELASLRTNKLVFMDLGAGISIAALTVLAFLFVKKIDSFSALGSIITVSAQGVFALANAAWLLMLLGTWWYYNFKAARGDYGMYPRNSESNIEDQIPFILVSLIPLNIFILLALIKNRLPCKLFIRPVDYTIIEIWKEFFWSSLILVNVIALVLFVVSGDHVSIVVNLVFTYVLLALRAGQMSSRESLVGSR